MKKLFIAFVIAASAIFRANAGSASPGIIINPYFTPTGTVLVTTDASQSAAPACATVPNRWAIDATTPAGKLQATAVLTAYAMGKRIAIWGTGTCSVWGDTEGVSLLQVIN
jgi:hypothetical protein